MKNLIGKKVESVVFSKGNLKFAKASIKEGIIISKLENKKQRKLFYLVDFGENRRFYRRLNELKVL